MIGNEVVNMKLKLNFSKSMTHPYEEQQPPYSPLASQVAPPKA